MGAEATKSDVSLGVEMTCHWNRILYDWYGKQHDTDQAFAASVPGGAAKWPIILDADDVITKPEVMVKYCESVGLDPTKLQYEWKAASSEYLEEINAFERRMRSTISASTGVVRGKTSDGLDLAEEARKWKQEFGGEEGARMEKWVLDAMLDYEYLKARRLR